MQGKQPGGVGFCGIIAAGIMMSLVGCDSRVSNEPTSASAAGRDVFDPTDAASHESGPAESSAKSLSSTADEEVARASEPEATSAARTLAPVVAPRPAAVEIAAENAVASIASPMTSSAMPASPAITDPNADPSQYPGGIVPASPNAQPLPGGPRLLVPERTFHAEGRPRALRVTYDDLDLLKVLNMGSPLPEDVVDQFPDWLSDLDGKTIRLRGFMYPAYQQELKAFVLTRDTGACCFGPNPKVYYLVGVKLKEGQTVRYIGDRPFDVVGTFHIAPTYIDGQWYQLYKLTDATVIE